MSRHRTLRAVGLSVSAAAALLLVAGPMPGEVWRAGDPVVGFQADAGMGDPPAPPAAAPPPDPLVPCDWAEPPLPDSELEIPDPADYLIEQEDGAFLLPDETVEVNGHELSLAELQDLQWLADDRGISLEEAILRRGWQNQFGQMVEELERAHPDQLADARIVDDGCGARLAFRDSVPARAVELAESLPVPVELVGDRGYHQAELVDALHEVYPEISGHPEVAAAGGGPDGATGVVTIEVQPRGDTDRTDRAALCRQLRPAQPANPAIEIRVILVEDLDSPTSRTHAC